MIHEASRPNRKARRGIIAGCLLFVAPFAGWWYWPRGDARLVGKWQLEYKSLAPGFSGNGTLWLYSNGASHFVQKVNTVSASSPWWVSEGRLFLGETRDSSHPLRVAADWFFERTWHHPLPPGEVFDIVALGQQQITLRSATDGIATLTRIPE
ncbi:hypothetical protein Pan44_08440 [Caulifigura coniformis]|uniref:Lipocalin-like domain-containing protein n=1 Tax=Caulifigura coniformis TaxID=2527983 RepID=A0A517S9N2_9PLAN|nr:hypothetical protein [Caulifigura coniformis]QDT52831.1 hypothetical protein Pan44_08440 [Caulifigura coniformis]